MTPDHIIPTPLKLVETTSAIIAGGAKNLHILADFDHTLTSEASLAVIRQIEVSHVLPPDYVRRADEYYNYYFPIENDYSLPRAERTAKMKEWWDAIHNLFIELGLTRTMLRTIVEQKIIHFRPGALEFIDELHQKNIPLVIISGGPGDLIAEHLRLEGRLYENVHIIANFYSYDAAGRMIGVKEPVVHIMNKSEILVANFPFYKEIEHRRNVILMGNHVGDTAMIDGFAYDNLLTVGFFNSSPDKDLPHFEEKFDVIITEQNASCDYVRDIIKKLV